MGQPPDLGITDMTENDNEEKGLCLFWKDGRCGEERELGRKITKPTSIIKGSNISV